MFLRKTVRSVRFLFTGPLILLMPVVINVMTPGHHGWLRWAVLGIGIAWVVSLLRVFRLMVVVGGIGALVAHLRRR